jgi:hypothetical protein
MRYRYRLPSISNALQPAIGNLYEITTCSRDRQRKEEQHGGGGGHKTRPCDQRGKTAPAPAHWHTGDGVGGQPRRCCRLRCAAAPQPKRHLAKRSRLPSRAPVLPAYRVRRHLLDHLSLQPPHDLRQAVARGDVEGRQVRVPHVRGARVRGGEGHAGVSGAARSSAWQDSVSDWACQHLKAVSARTPAARARPREIQVSRGFSS